MGKNANFVSHKKSKQIINGKPKLPLAADLVEGEIAINFGKDVETLSIKNESGDVVTFSSDNYYTEQKLGSGFTGENSGMTVTEALENVEVTVDQVIDETTSASTNAVATKAVYDFVTSSPLIITVDQVLDDTTSASTNPVSSKAVYDAVTDNELVWTNAYVALSGAVSSHTEDTTVHITAADRAKLDSITGSFGTMAFEDKTSYSSATEVNSALSNKSDVNHEHGADSISALTNYQIASSASSISTTDTLIEAIGKLEYRLKLLEDALIVQSDGQVYADANPT